jgi:hypothetical protein
MLTTAKGRKQPYRKASDSASDKGAENKAQTPRQLAGRVKVGRELPDGIDIVEVRKIEHRNNIERGQFRVVVAMTTVFSSLFVWITAYAISTNNLKMVEEILDFVKMGLVFMAVWATGKAALKVLSAWKAQDSE